MGIVSEARRARSLLRRVANGRSALREVRREQAARPPAPPAHFRIAVYFADGDVNMYQIRQWYRPLAAVAGRWPVVVFSRHATGARALLADDALPVAFVPKVRDLEHYIAQQDIRVVLYVNQNTRNFQMFRYGRRWHVFINHGESDKMYMTTNQFKAYDYALVAGEAARDRLSRTLWDYDVDRRTIAVGRPQTDHYVGEPPYEPDERTVVLYAPTWEGDRPAARYGSLRSHGEALVAALLSSPRYRLIYRPHPRSGVVDPEYGAANAHIVAAITAANASDPTARHVVDAGGELGWQLLAADIAVVDISAMVYDRLATSKPLLITRPVDPAADVDTNGYLSDAEWLDAAGAADVDDRITRVLDDPDAAARLARWVQRYFGDTAPGAASARFEAAIAELMRRWETWDAASRADATPAASGPSAAVEG